jgi:hypothetical protein
MLIGLRVFIYEFNCTTDIVIELGKYCNLLMFLDIEYSSNVTDDCVEYLLNLRNLEYLNIGGTSISEMTYSLILSRLPRIMNVYLCREVDNVLQNVKKECLPSVIEFFGFVSNLSLLRKMCPRIKKLSIILQNVNTFELLHLTNLTFLELGPCHYNVYNLKNIFIFFGRRLTYLGMFYVKDINMFEIVCSCSVLKTLVVKHCSLTMSVDLVLAPKLPHFRSVKKIMLESNQGFNIFPRYVHYYSNLEVFNAELVMEIQDETMGAILNSGGFRNLSELVARECGPLTLQTAALLIRRCANLSYLGKLSTWSGVSVDDLMTLLHYVKVNNLALTIV